MARVERSRRAEGVWVVVAMASCRWLELKGDRGSKGRGFFCVVDGGSRSGWVEMGEGELRKKVWIGFWWAGGIGLVLAQKHCQYLQNTLQQYTPVSNTVANYSAKLQQRDMEGEMEGDRFAVRLWTDRPAGKKTTLVERVRCPRVVSKFSQ